VISRNLYINIALRVVSIVAFAILTAWVIVSDKPVIVSLAGVTAIALTTINLIKYLNSTNRKISYFLESVENEDSGLTFPLTANSRTIRDLGNSLDRINDQIRKLRIESRQQEQYFQTLMEHVATGIITYNQAGFIIHANSSAKKMLSVDVLTHIRQLERVNRKIFHTIQNIKPPEQQMVSYVTERGTVQLLLKASAFRNGNEDLIILSLQDIRNELDEKELDSWIKLIRVMMHEIINSIAPITSLSESLGKLYTANGRPVEPGTVDEKTIQKTIQGLGVIRSQGDGLLSFIESYRRLTRLPKPEKKIIKTEDLLSRIALLYQSFESRNKSELTVRCVPDNMEILADEGMVSLCLINLVKNAMQANEENCEGRIMVVAGIVNGRTEISITDNGPGISAELLEEIFVPFFTTREDGSGIGLSISRQIMRLHGGSLRVKSIPQKETVFTMAF
jgi:two-component system, NtrC family, nitrogen regulation sensor histidine kinase NtrY